MAMAYRIDPPVTRPAAVSYIRQTRDLYDGLGYPPYQWFEADTDPALAPLKKPLSQSRLGLISSSGTYLEGQVAYYYKDDTSIREISSQSDLSDMRFSHITENYLTEAWQDPGVIFPIEPLRRLQKEGLIGELADNFISCMGGIYSQRRVHQELIPNIEIAIERQQLDLLLLVPL